MIGYRSAHATGDSKDPGAGLQWWGVGASLGAGGGDGGFHFLESISVHVADHTDSANMRCPFTWIAMLAAGARMIGWHVELFVAPRGEMSFAPCI